MNGNRYLPDTPQCINENRQIAIGWRSHRGKRLHGGLGGQTGSFEAVAVCQKTDGPQGAKPDTEHKHHANERPTQTAHSPLPLFAVPGKARLREDDIRYQLSNEEALGCAQNTGGTRRATGPEFQRARQ